ncbi:protein of unknown function [Desulfovibrio sp. 86]|nr:protein of unknown function [Desulfovibrio sp. 86]
MAYYERGGLVRLCSLGKLPRKMFERRLPQVKHLFQIFFGHAIAHEDIHFQNEVSVFVNVRLGVHFLGIPGVDLFLRKILDLPHAKKLQSAATVAFRTAGEPYGVLGAFHPALEDGRSLACDAQVRAAETFGDFKYCLMIGGGDNIVAGHGAAGKNACQAYPQRDG